jgi:hypothetical protein
VMFRPIRNAPHRKMLFLNHGTSPPLDQSTRMLRQESI